MCARSQGGWGNNLFALRASIGSSSDLNLLRSAEERIAAYFLNQEAHHRKMTFQQELLKLLNAHEIDYDEGSI